MIPAIEIEAISVTLDHILHCRLKSLPTEVLAHNFLIMFHGRQKRLRPYSECLHSVDVKEKASMALCRNHIKNLCPRRFGDDIDKQDICRKLLWDVRGSPSDYSMSEWNKVIGEHFNGQATILGTRSEEVLNSFRQYHYCMGNLTEKLSRCLPHFENTCNSSVIRSVKTVRATMESAVALRELDSNLKVIHLVRDPRAVSLSRLKQKSFRGKQSGKDMVKEAHLYCNQVSRDVKVRKTVQPISRSSFYQIIYEDFVSLKNCTRQSESVYNALNAKVPKSVVEWLEENTEVKKNASQLASAWMKELKYENVYHINKACLDFFNETGINKD